MIHSIWHSIRWRLVASYGLLTLLTVSVVGLLALSLVARYADQQEAGYLTTSAQELAQQAEALLGPPVQADALHDLAHTASFLTNAQVRIFDGSHRLLAESDPGVPGADQMIWLTQLHGDARPAGDAVFALADDEQAAAARSADPSGRLKLTVVRRLITPWGNRMVLGGHSLWSGPPGATRIELSKVESGAVPGHDLPKSETVMTAHAGRLAVGAPVANQAELPRSPAPANVNVAVDNVAVDTVLRSDQVVAVPIGLPVKPVGVVELSHGPNLAAEALASTRHAFSLAAVGALLLAVLVGLVVSRGLTSPLENLSAAAGRMSAGDLSSRAPVAGAGEIADLARQFNRMAARLEESFAELAADRDALRHFIADASHELRTPITALKNFNSLLAGAAAADPAAMREFVTESAAQIDRLEWITHHLLDLSRLEAGLVTLDLADCDLAGVLETVAATFRVTAEARGVALSVEPPAQPLAVQVDRGRLVVALANLVDNAVKFTPRGGRVVLGAARMANGAGKSDTVSAGLESVAQDQETAAPGDSASHGSPDGSHPLRIWVEDTGSGIDPADRPQVFERFYRGRRTGEGDIPGSGLGLAIVRGIVQLHGGKVWVEDGAGGSGTRVVVAL